MFFLYPRKVEILFHLKLSNVIESKNVTLTLTVSYDNCVLYKHVNKKLWSVTGKKKKEAN